MSSMTRMGLVAAALSGMLSAAEDGELKAAARLAAGQDETRIVCFGDSITGVYYHTGGRRAWPKLLEQALRQTYPKAAIRVFNAGVSGNTTDAALKRIQRDVLARHPHVVAVMFGMNDLAYGKVSPEKDQARKAHFQKNLVRIAELCRNAGAEVLFMTPNPVYPEAAPQRPPARVGEYAALIAATSRQLGIPLVDTYDAWCRVRQEDPRTWRIMMSETIHPSLAGHRLFAEMVASTLHGAPVRLADLTPLRPYLPHTAAAIASGKPLHIIVADSVAPRVEAAFKTLAPKADATYVAWPVKGADLAAIEAWARSIRKHQGTTLVVGAFSPRSADIGPDEEAYTRRVSWLVDLALPFGTRTWDIVFVSPALDGEPLTPAQTAGAAIMRDVVEAHDIPWIGPEATPGTGDVIESWFRRELAGH